MSDEPETGGAGWIDMTIHSRVHWRDGDVIVSAPTKNGTTWVMNIVHQLRAGGDPDFEDLCVEVPWLELVERPGQPPEERLQRWSALPTTRRRAFKSHASPPVLPYVAPGEGRPEVRYVVVLRNPEEAVISFEPFFARHSQALYDLWGFDRQAVVHDSFAAFYEAVIEPMSFDANMFRFLAAWWPHRHRPNVQLMHYADLCRDPEGSIRQIATFLDFSPTPTQWPKILECCSFAWMKAKQSKFELRKVAAVPILEPGAMLRKGQAGAARTEGMTKAIAARMRAKGESILDEQALTWHYKGGPLPSRH